MAENWIPVLGYEGLYEVSNLGRVKSVERKSLRCFMGRTPFVYVIPERILKQNIDKYGYHHVVLYGRDGKPKNSTVHRIVLSSFTGKNIEDLQVNHKDEIKTNNSIENLEWVTCSENINYGTRNEKVSKRFVQMDLFGNEIATFKSSRDAGRILGVNHASICACAKGKLKTAGGYTWRYL